MEARNSKKLKPKTGSFSEPRFGGQRTLTQPFVSVRCPPKRGSENEPVFGFRKGFRKRIFFQLQSLAKSLNFNHFVQMQFAVSKHISAPLPPRPSNRHYNASNPKQAYPADCCGDDELFFASNEGGRRADEQTSLFKSSDSQQ